MCKSTWYPFLVVPFQWVVKLGHNTPKNMKRPQVQVAVGPMWVAKYETTWTEYKLFMSMYKLLKDLQSQQLRLIDDKNKVDAITAPTELYEPSYTFEFGDEPKLPAVTMTQYAAKQYTKWLSKSYWTTIPTPN